MQIVRRSFISNLLGRKNYEDFKSYAKVIVPIGTIILVILLVLSLFVHWGFVSSLLNLVTGTSLLFIAYIGVIILLLDVEVEVEEPESSYYWEEPVKTPKPLSYKLTIVWGVILILLGVLAIYYSNKYRKHYAFECNTFLVDEKAGIYHIDYDNDCEYAANADNLIRMKGYEIEENTTCTFCEWCEEWVEDAESEIY